jgi:hypothetical protein
LYEIVEDYHRRDILVLFVRLRDQNKQLFVRSGIVDLVGSMSFFRKITDAISFYELGGHPPALRPIIEGATSSPQSERVDDDEDSQSPSVGIPPMPFGSYSSYNIL